MMFVWLIIRPKQCGSSTGISRRHQYLTVRSKIKLMESGRWWRVRRKACIQRRFAATVRSFIRGTASLLSRLSFRLARPTCTIDLCSRMFTSNIKQPWVSKAQTIIWTILNAYPFTATNLLAAKSSASTFLTKEALECPRSSSSCLQKSFSLCIGMLALARIAFLFSSAYIRYIDFVARSSL